MSLGGAWEFLFLTSSPGDSDNQSSLANATLCGIHQFPYSGLCICHITLPFCGPVMSGYPTHSYAEILRAGYNRFQVPHCCSVSHLEEFSCIRQYESNSAWPKPNPSTAPLLLPAHPPTLSNSADDPASAQMAEPEIFGTSLFQFLLHSSLPGHCFLVISSSYKIQIRPSSSFSLPRHHLVPLLTPTTFLIRLSAFILCPHPRSAIPEEENYIFQRWIQ